MTLINWFFSWMTLMNWFFSWMTLINWFFSWMTLMNWFFSWMTLINWFFSWMTNRFFFSSELPFPPIIVQVFAHDDSPGSVSVAWTAGADGNSPIKGYIIQYKEIVQGETIFGNLFLFFFFLFFLRIKRTWS